MKKIIIADLMTNNDDNLFHKLSLSETETISGGTLNSYFISSNTGDTTTGVSNTTETGTIHDNKVNTMDYSRSTYIIINSV